MICNDQGKEKLILLTGGNSGIGLEACKILCARGHKVVATVRSDDKGAHCISEVKVAVPNGDIHYMLCELSDPYSVRKLAETFQKTWLVDGQLLDVLVNNAGCLQSSSKRVTCENNPEWELSVATNAIAPILLTDLLIENLKETAAKKGEARVLMVSSDVVVWDTYVPYQTDLSDLMMTKPKAYKGGSVAYKSSKVALMQATLALAQEMEGSNVKVNSMSPGMIPKTNLVYATAYKSQRCRWSCLLCFLETRCCMDGQSNEQGGQYIVQMADEELGGESHGLFYIRGNLMSPPPQCEDKSKQKKMLEILRNLVSPGGEADDST